MLCPPSGATSKCDEYHILPSPTQPLRCILASSDTSNISAALLLQQTPHPCKPETAPMHPRRPKAPHCPTRSLTVSEATHYLRTSRSLPCPLVIDPRLTLEYIATLITLPHCSEPPTRYYRTWPLNYTPVVWPSTHCPDGLVALCMLYSTLYLNSKLLSIVQHSTSCN
jgi:hypothetical protein